MKKVIIGLLVSVIIYELYLYQKKIEEKKRIKEQKRIEEEQKRIEEEQKRMEVPVWKRITLFLISYLILTSLKLMFIFLYNIFYNREPWRNDVLDLIEPNKYISLIIKLLSLVFSILATVDISFFDYFYINMMTLFLIFLGMFLLNMFFIYKIITMATQ